LTVPTEEQREAGLRLNGCNPVVFDANLDEEHPGKGIPLCIIRSTPRRWQVCQGSCCNSGMIWRQTRDWLEAGVRTTSPPDLARSPGQS
jgi:hypothetical protein